MSSYINKDLTQQIMDPECPVVSAARLGDFQKLLVTNFLTKVMLGNFENIIYQEKMMWLIFGQLLEKLGILCLFKHLVTLPVVFQQTHTYGAHLHFY